MVNLTIIILLILLLIVQKIILLNEETLILLCFLLFSIASIQKFSGLFSQELISKNQNLELKLQTLFKKQFKVLSLYAKRKNNIKGLLNNFKNLKKHFLDLIIVISSILPLYKQDQLAKTWPKSFLFAERIENQSIKFVSLLISEKLLTIVILKCFYLKNFNISYFNCLQKISMQELIQLTLGELTKKSEYR
uniref:ATP synthase B chain n=1 Tax=Sporolithon durum TaxID=48970 RepID=V9P4U7_9FLOR|nr:ATP synthase B chain precursor [Sporolithon durum]AGU16680.1 ATP synthase B chain precursor [Sporolithon durum]